MMTIAEQRPVEGFLVRSVRAFIGEGAPPSAPGGTAWAETAVEHGVLAPVLEVVTDQDDVLLDYSHIKRQSRVAREMRSAADLEFLKETLDGAGISWAMLKGPVLAQEVFEHKRVRDYVDLDAIVAPQDLRRSIQALAEAGARPIEVDWGSVEWSRAAEAPVSLPYGTTLDLHWTLINRLAVRRAYPDPTQDMLNRRQVVRLQGLEVPTLDDLDFCLHVMLHGCLDGCAKLRNLLDAQQCVLWLASRGHRPEDFGRRVRETRASAAIGSLLRRAAEHLDPAVQGWADAVGGRNGWTRVADALDAAAPPGAVASPLGRKMHRHTCPTTVQSIRAVGEREVVRVAEVWESRSRRRNAHASLPGGIASWLDYVEGRPGS